MASILKPKKSNTPGAVPTTASLADGEMAVNTADKKFFVRVGAAIVDMFNRVFNPFNQGNGFISWTGEATVTPSTSVALLDSTGAALSPTKTYKVAACNIDSSAQRGAVALFVGDGSDFTVKTVYEQGTSSSNVQLYLNAGVPSVSVYGGSGSYRIPYRIEEVPNFGQGLSEFGILQRITDAPSDSKNYARNNAAWNALGTAATANTGTTGATVPLQNGNANFSGSLSCTGSFSVLGKSNPTIAFPGYSYCGFRRTPTALEFRFSTTVATWWVDNVGYIVGGFKAFGPAIYPTADNATDIGASSLRFKTVYAATGTINTSDARQKTPVRSLQEREIAAAEKLASAIGAYKWLDAIRTKGDGARTHIGMTVQQAIEIMLSEGLEPFTYGFICFDQWDAKNEVLSDGLTDDDAPTVVQCAVPAGDSYSFRMDELLLFIATGFDARLKRVEAAFALHT